MVASKVTVISRALGSAEAWKWESKGVEGYTVTPCEKAAAGTDVILVIKENTDEEKYDEYLDDFAIAGIVKKYSDYIRYPIKMLREKSRIVRAPTRTRRASTRRPSTRATPRTRRSTAWCPCGSATKKT